MKLTSEAQPGATQGPVSYPSLWQSSFGALVLMHGPRQGVVVGNLRAAQDVGFYSDHWDMGSFEPFYGTVTLKSEAA